MPTWLTRSSKDNLIHGTENDKFTGCKKKISASAFTKEGEMKDIMDLTCDYCKEYYATKMIRESNREEARIAKEEKKRFQKAKKQGIVRESTYEEYVYNRESEASAKLAAKEKNGPSGLYDEDEKVDSSPTQPSFTTYGQNSGSPSPVQAPFDPYKINNAAPAPSPVQAPFDPYKINNAAPAPSSVQAPFDPYKINNAAPAPSPVQAPFDPYKMNNASPAPSPVQAPFDPYTQQSSVTPPPIQSPFDPYTQQSSVTPPPIQAPFDPYAQQSSVTPPPIQSPFDPYAQQSSVTPPPIQSPFNPYSQSVSIEDIKPEENKPEEVTPIFQSYSKSAFESPVSDMGLNDNKDSDDSFLSKFIIGQNDNLEKQEIPAPTSTPNTAQSILSNARDILAQFDISDNSSLEPAPAPIPTPAPAPKRGDASSFFNDQVPLVGAEYATPASVNSSSNEFGSLNISETPAQNDDFVVPDVPVYQPKNLTDSVFESSQIDELKVPDISSLEPASKPDYMSSFAGFDNDPLTAEDNDIVSPSISKQEDTFGTIPTFSPDISHSDDIINGFDEFESISPVQSVKPIQPVQPIQSAPSLNSFESIAPVQPAPAVNNFNKPQPQVQAPFDPYKMSSSSQMQPMQTPVMNSYNQPVPMQPASAPVMNNYNQPMPMQPASAPVMNNYNQPVPMQPASAPVMNNYNQPMPMQPASAPVMNNYNQPVPMQPVQKPVMNNYNQPVNAYNNPSPQMNMNQQNGFQQPQQYNQFSSIQNPAFSSNTLQFNNPAPKKPAVMFDQGGNAADSIEEALRQLGADVTSTNSAEGAQSSDKEDVVPDFVSYVPSSSRVLHIAPPSSQSQQSGSSTKRPMTAKEAKQLAKIDAKFKKDLAARGYNPNEVRSQRRGK